MRANRVPEFDKNAAYIWVIVALGVLAPMAMAVFASVRLRMAKQRLERLREDKD